MTDSHGLHEQVDLLGQSFDVQTELLDRETGAVRTVIFHQGAVAARQEARLPPSATDEELERALRKLHGSVIEGFMVRALGFEARAAGASLRVEATVQTPSEEAPSELPPIPEDPALADAIEVRRLIGRLLARMQLAPIETTASGWKGWLGLLGRRLGVSGPNEELASRLESARRAFSWAIVQPGFHRIRIDEQVRFHILRERMEDWRAENGRSDIAEALWQDALTFCDYLREVNLRADLLAFDRRLLDWAMAFLNREGSPGTALRSLTWLEGRDMQLDSLFSDPGTVDTSALLREMRRVRQQLG